MATLWVCYGCYISQERGCAMTVLWLHSSQEIINVSAVPMAPWVFFQLLCSCLAYPGFSAHRHSEIQWDSWHCKQDQQDNWHHELDLIRALFPFMRFLPSCPNYHPKAPCPNTITLRIQHMNLGWHQVYLKSSDIRFQRLGTPVQTTFTFYYLAGRLDLAEWFSPRVSQMGTLKSWLWLESSNIKLGKTIKMASRLGLACVAARLGQLE